MDISGVLDAQRNYLTAISTSATGTPTGTVGDINEINTKLNQLSTSLGQNSAAYILAHQDEMKGIVKAENDRLEKKKTGIDQAYEGQKRMIDFNQNYSKRMAQYTKITITVVFALLAILAILLINRNIPLPDGIVEIVIMIVIVVAAIYSVSVYNTILGRDTVDFDKISIDSPSILTPSQIKSQIESNQASGNLLGSINVGNCAGPACCSDGTIWDAKTQTCVALCPAGKTWDKSKSECIATVTASASATIQSFTTLAMAYSPIQLVATSNKSNESKPYEPSEFDNYAKI